jgi:ATP-dependent DNA helicase RecG
MSITESLDLDALVDLIQSDLLYEDLNREAKKAAGKDGNGELPRSFFESYSAMANTNGGIILLGIEENPKNHFSVHGLKKVQKIREDLLNTLNNKQKVSKNLLKDSDISEVQIADKTILLIRVPRASRQEKPVYINNNPITGTYRRNFQGDYLSDESLVKRMLAEQVNDGQDKRLIPHTGIDDLHLDSFLAYRNLFRITNLSHTWNNESDIDFLTHLQGYRKDRETGEEGLTIAGLLMFGKWETITEFLPEFFLDYREIPEGSASVRWIDRLVPDGNWSGNLFDFFQLTYRRLKRDLKSPFHLKDGQRVEDTPAEAAIREALVNALIHADYSGSVSTLIEKRVDRIIFRNPGTMRIPLEQAALGGTSDCRNRGLQVMFRMVGFGDQAGSGIPSIFSNWAQEQYRNPHYIESFSPDTTTLTLCMIHLFPENILTYLDSTYGASFHALSHEQKIALALAYSDGEVTHKRIREMSGIHPSDLTKDLKTLVDLGFLVPEGESRGRVYFPNAPFRDTVARSYLTDNKGESSIPHSDVSLPYLDPSLPHSGVNLPYLDPSLPYSKDTVSPSLVGVGVVPLVESIENEMRGRKHIPKKEMESFILNICSEHFQTLTDIALILHRTEKGIRDYYVRPMVRKGLLIPRYPDKKTHPDQAYIRKM